jgi:hypothetical protein
LEKNLARRIRGVPTTNPRRPKELSEGETGEQRAAADACCEDDQFSGDDLHSNSYV